MGKLKQFIQAKRINSRGTARNYLSGINYFLYALDYYDKVGRNREMEELDKSAEEYLKDIKEEEKKKREENELRTDWSMVYNHLQQFIYYLKKKGLSGGTISNHITAVRSFLGKNDIHLDSQVYQEKVDQPKKRVISWDKKLKRKQLAKILSHTKVKGTALFTFLVSSGIRVSGALRIELNELALQKNPPRAYLRGGKTKEGRKRIVFFSNEAKSYIEEWLSGEREKYLELRKKKIEGIKTIEAKEDGDGRLFPMDRTNASKMWNRLLEKAGLDERDEQTGRRIYHLHTLRKFFKSEAQKVIPKPIVEAMIGHKQGLDKAYSRYSEKELADYYKQIEGRVSVFQSPKELSMKVDRQSEKVKELKEQLDRRNNKVEQLEHRLEQFVKEKGKTTTVYELMDIVEDQSERLKELEDKLEE